MIYFEKRIPKLAKLVQRKMIDRIKDDDRLNLFLDLAAELDSGVKLDHFKQVFNDAKKLRDFAAHAARIETVSPDSVRLVKSIWTGPKGDLKDARTVPSSELQEEIRNCEWMHDQVLYVLMSSDLVDRVYLAGREREPVKPPSDPKEWDGGVFGPS